MGGSCLGTPLFWISFLKQVYKQIMELCESSVLMSCGNRRSDKGLVQKATPHGPLCCSHHPVQTLQLESKARNRFPQKAVIGNVSPIPKVCLDQVTLVPPLSPVGSSWCWQGCVRLIISSETLSLGGVFAASAHQHKILALVASLSRCEGMQLRAEGPLSSLSRCSSFLDASSPVVRVGLLQCYDTHAHFWMFAASLSLS